MITPRDIKYVERIAPAAQLLELLVKPFDCDGGPKERQVRRPEVYEVTAQDLWEAFFYLRTRLADEAGHLTPKEWPDSYFDEIEAMARKASI